MGSWWKCDCTFRSSARFALSALAAWGRDTHGYRRIDGPFVCLPVLEDGDTQSYQLGIDSQRHFSCYYEYSLLGRCISLHLSNAYNKGALGKGFYLHAGSEGRFQGQMP